MRFSARVEYAAIAVLNLACLGKHHGPINLRAICEDQGVPAGFVVQILLQLKRAGLVTSSRGAGGGYRLAKPADEITLRDIYVAIEGPMTRPAPVAAGLATRSRGAAVLAKAWAAACRAEGEALASYTIADLVVRTASVSEPMYYI